MGYPISAFMLIELTQGRLAEAVERLSGAPEVLEADAVSGPQDLICRVVARDTEHLQELVNDLLATPAIRRCTSYIVLSRQVPPRSGPLVASAGGGAGGSARRPTPRCARWPSSPRPAAGRSSARRCPAPRASRRSSWRTSSATCARPAWCAASAAPRAATGSHAPPGRSPSPT